MKDINTGFITLFICLSLSLSFSLRSNYSKLVVVVVVVVVVKIILWLVRVDDGFDFVVHDQNHRTTDTSQDVRERTLEERARAFGLVNLNKRIQSAGVRRTGGVALLTGGHHQTSTNGIKRIGQDTRGVRGDLRDDELRNHGRIPGQQGTLPGIVETKVRTSVHDDTLDGNAKALV